MGGRHFRCRQLRRETPSACDSACWATRPAEPASERRASKAARSERLALHRHTNCSEAYFGLDGLVTVTVEGASRTLGREDFVLVPRGTGHTFGNRSGEPARLLVIHAPAMDAYFAALHDLWNGPQPPEPAQERELMARFGMERPGPA